MDPVFTLPYSEYAVIDRFTKQLSKRQGFSVYVPASRQEKGVDFLVHNSKQQRSLRFQVKSSRSYINDDKKSLSKGHLKYTLWFNNFRKRYMAGEADYYILFGLYPDYTVDSQIAAKKSFWCPLILCFRDEEMKALLDSVLTKKERKPDRFFYIAFDTHDQVYGTRGFTSRLDLSCHLFERQMPNIIKELTSNQGVQRTGAPAADA
jgi:hypothetical protein